MNIKRVVLIMLPIVLVVGAFAAALAYYQPVPSEVDAKNFFRKKTVQSSSLTVKGVLVEGGIECQRMQASDGKYYTLAPRSLLEGYKTGDAVIVEGDLPTVSFCQQDTPLNVRSVSRVGTPPVDSGVVQQESGITGTVMMGPTCPVVNGSDGTKCADKPYSTTIWVMSGDGSRQVTSFVSDKDGKFKIKLVAGTYVLQRPTGKDDARYPMMNAQTIVVKTGAYTPVEIQFDSGIR
jgi:hypothetical protein